MIGFFYIPLRLHGVGTDTEQESVHKVDSGAENSPAAPAGIRTRNLSITSPALSPTSYPGSSSFDGDARIPRPTWQMQQFPGIIPTVSVVCDPAEQSQTETDLYSLTRCHPSRHSPSHKRQLEIASAPVRPEVLYAVGGTLKTKN